MGTTTDARALTRTNFPVLIPQTTRWADNDMFGHMNNAVYFGLFDSAINGWMAAQTGRDPQESPEMPVVAESTCRFFREVGFPHPVSTGLRVANVGRSSVVYELGLFDDREPDGTVSAYGRWVHVYVDKASRSTVSVPDPVRDALEQLRVEDGGESAGAVS
ncbi:acyl-CoA thioesterase [Georgenia sp. Z1491]|uniref:acyl-CoA thioesterase n=1 Tax=Georgenia sp. Z1491 TaxID=3416707 RepID=UPI003CEAF64C